MSPGRLALLMGVLWSAIVAAAGQRAAPVELALGQPITAELTSGQSHSYRVALARGDFVNITIEQLGIDVSATLVGPERDTIVSVDAMDDEFRPETVVAIVTSSGPYTVVVHPTSATGARGRYRVRLETVRQATGGDETLVEAERSFARGRAIRDSSKAATWPEALTAFTAALDRYRQLGDRRGEMKALIEVGVTQYFLFRPEALQTAQQAARIARELNDRAALARALKSAGNTLVYQGDLASAARTLDESTALSRAIGSRDAEARGLNDAAIAYRRMGDIESAMTRYEAALPLARATGDRTMEARILNNLGVVYKVVGDFDRARQMYEQSLANRRAANDSRGVYNALSNLGNLDRRFANYVRAQQFHQRALEIARAIPDAEAESSALNHLGEDFSDAGDYEKAAALLGDALRIRKQSGDIWGQVGSATDLAAALHGLGRDEEAEAAEREALTIARTFEGRFFERDALAGFATIERDRGALPDAQHYAEQSVALDERLRGSITAPELRASFVAAERDTYELLIDILQRRHLADPTAGYAAAALHASERARARVLLESVLDPRVNVREGIEPALLERERAIQKQLNDASAQLSRLLAQNARDQTAPASQKVERLAADHQELQAQIRRQSPRYAALMQPQPLTAPEIEGQVLDDDTVLLEYSLGDDRSWLWAVTRQDVTSIPLAPRREIDAATRSLYREVTARQRRRGETAAEFAKRVEGADARYRKDASRVSAMLLGGIARQLTGEWQQKRLVIVAGEALDYVPFAAMPAPAPDGAGAPLAFRHEVVVIPSASVLAAVRREKAERSPADRAVAIVADPVFDAGDPRVAAAMPRPASLRVNGNRTRSSSVRQGFARLPFSRDEANAIADVAGETGVFTATDFQASRDTVLGGALRGYRIVHFATHGTIDSQHPALSSLVLSLVDERGRAQNGYIRLSDIYNMRLDADLVVLSACQTALGKEIRGEGLVSLARAFMYAGAPRIVASLWEVNDAATAELMARFYRGMLKQHLSAAAALRVAQVDMAKTSRWKSPYYWAGFVLQGDWQ